MQLVYAYLLLCCFISVFAGDLLENNTAVLPCYFTLLPHDIQNIIADFVEAEESDQEFIARSQIRLPVLSKHIEQLKTLLVGKQFLDYCSDRSRLLYVKQVRTGGTYTPEAISLDMQSETIKQEVIFTKFLKDNTWQVCFIKAIAYLPVINGALLAILLKNCNQEATNALFSQQGGGIESIVFDDIVLICDSRNKPKNNGECEGFLIRHAIAPSLYNLCDPTHLAFNKAGTKLIVHGTNEQQKNKLKHAIGVGTKPAPEAEKIYHIFDRKNKKKASITFENKLQKLFHENLVCKQSIMPLTYKPVNL